MTAWKVPRYLQESYSRAALHRPFARISRSHFCKAVVTVELNGQSFCCFVDTGVECAFCSDANGIKVEATAIKEMPISESNTLDRCWHLG